MFFKRRKVRKCEVCKVVLVRREDESIRSFNKRSTCSEEHADILRHAKKVHSKCFCGNTIEIGSDYCCYDHRVIAIKCRQWRIPISLDDYENECKRRDKEQKELNKGGYYSSHTTEVLDHLFTYTKDL